MTCLDLCDWGFFSPLAVKRVLQVPLISDLEKLLNLHSVKFKICMPEIYEPSSF